MSDVGPQTLDPRLQAPATGEGSGFRYRQGGKPTPEVWTSDARNQLSAYNVRAPAYG